jgi:hypothetical protein
MLLDLPRYGDAGGVCRPGPHLDVGESTADLGIFALSVTANRDGALVVWRSGEDEIRARALDPNGEPRGEAHTAALPRPHLIRAAAQPDGTFVVASQPFCASDDGTPGECVALRTLAPDGRAIEPLATASLGPRSFAHPWMIEGARGAVGLALPSTLETGEPLVIRLEPHGGGAASIETSPIAVAVPRGESSRLDEVAVDRTGRYAIALRGVTGDVLLREGEPPRPIAGLPPGGPVVIAAGDDVRAAYVERDSDRAVVVRLGAEAEVVASVERGRGALPSPFDRVRARVDVGMGGCLHVSRWMPGRGALAHEVTHVWDCVDTDRSAVPRSVVWSGSVYLVAHARHERDRWIVRVTPLECGAPS